MPDEFFVVQLELFLNFSFTVRLKNLKWVKRQQKTQPKRVFVEGSSRDDRSIIYSLKFLFTALLATIANSDRRHGLEFDCNQEASDVQNPS